MSENKGLIQMLAQCEKSEFDEVVKSYLKAIYKTKTLVITDGKNDGGLDVKVMDMPLKKLQFQMTVQKSSTAQERKKLEEKMLADVAKAQKMLRIMDIVIDWNFSILILLQKIL